MNQNKTLYIFIALITVLLVSCMPIGQTNQAIVEIKGGVVTTTIPKTATKGVRFEKAADIKSPAENVFFRYNKEDGQFECRVDLQKWQPFASDDCQSFYGNLNVYQDGEILRVKYPSGQWAVP